MDLAYIFARAYSSHTGEVPGEMRLVRISQGMSQPGQVRTCTPSHQRRCFLQAGPL